MANKLGIIFHKSLRVQKASIALAIILLFPFPIHARVVSFTLNVNLTPLEELGKKIQTISLFPYNAIAFSHSILQEQGDELSQKTLTLLRSPYELTRRVKNNINYLPKQVASLFSAQESTKSQITNYKQIPNPNDQISKPLIATPSEARGKQSQIQDTKYQILNTTREIIREVVVKDQSNISNISNASNISNQLTALKDELTQSFNSRINKLTTPFGFQSNRFDELTAQKGVTAGSGNVKIINSAGKIPALSSAYFETLPNIFSSIGNASSTVQFTAGGINDILSFEATGGLLTISFDAATKKITFSASAPTLLSVLNQGADASAFSGTTKLGGTLQVPTITTASGALTLNPTGDLQFYSSSNKIDSSGNLTLAGFFTINANATSTIENNLWVKGALRVGTSSITLTETGIASTGGLTLSPSGDLQFFSSSNKITSSGSITLAGGLTVSGSATSTIAGSLDVGSGKLFVSSGGNIGIGTTTNLTEKLTLSGNIGFTGGAKIKDNSGRLELQAGGAGTGNQGTSSIYFLNSSGTAQGRFETTGQINPGDGVDGAITISAAKNINTETIASGRTYADGIAYRVNSPADNATSVTRYSAGDTLSNGISAGDEVLLINMQGTASDSADVGKYEFLEVSSVTASTLTFTVPISKSFDGTTASNQKVVIQRVPNYTNVTFSGSGSLTASAWDGLTTTPSGAAGYLTGIVAFRASGTVTLASGTSITTSQKGFRGGTSGSNGPEFYQGNSTTGGVNGTNGSTRASSTTGGAGGAGGGSGGGAGSSGCTSTSSCYSATATDGGAGKGGGGAGGGRWPTGTESRTGGNGGTGGEGGGGGGGGGSVDGSSAGGGAGGGGKSYSNVVNQSPNDLSQIFLGSGASQGAGSGGVGAYGSSPWGGGGGGQANGSGGSAGSGDGVAGGNGANGNTGGGIIFLYANSIVASGANAIIADGGNGGTGGSSPDADVPSVSGKAIGGGGQGGNGASGGTVLIGASTINFTTNSLTAKGGSGGNGGTGSKGYGGGECERGNGGTGATFSAGNDTGGLGQGGGRAGWNASGCRDGGGGGAGAGGSSGYGGKVRIEYITNNGATLANSADPDASSSQTFGSANYGTFFTGATNTSAGDLAEYYVTGDTNIDAGDLVSISNTGLLSDGGEEISTQGVLRKSSTPYDGKLIGVISTSPGVLMGSIDSTTGNKDQRMLALAGRVPVKVSGENGPIAIGDHLTSSSKPGVAMKATKAGITIGIALEPFTGEKGGEGKINVFVNLGYIGNDLRLTTNDQQQIEVTNEPLIDKHGNQLALTHEGTVVIKRLVVKDLELAKGGTVTLPAGSGELLGKVTIPQGLTYSIIENPLIKPSSYIFLTLEGTPITEISYGIVNKKEGQFTLQLSRGAPEAMIFQYWIVDSYDTNGAAFAPATASQSATSTVP